MSRTRLNSSSMKSKRQRRGYSPKPSRGHALKLSGHPRMPIRQARTAMPVKPSKLSEVDSNDMTCSYYIIHYGIIVTNPARVVFHVASAGLRSPSVRRLSPINTRSSSRTSSGSSPKSLRLSPINTRSSSRTSSGSSPKSLRTTSGRSRNATGAGSSNRDRSSSNKHAGDSSGKTPTRSKTTTASSSNRKRRSSVVALEDQWQESRAYYE